MAKSTGLHEVLERLARVELAEVRGHDDLAHRVDLVDQVEDAARRVSVLLFVRDRLRIARGDDSSEGDALVQSLHLVDAPGRLHRDTRDVERDLGERTAVFLTAFEQRERALAPEEHLEDFFLRDVGAGRAQHVGLHQTLALDNIVEAGVAAAPEHLLGRSEPLDVESAGGQEVAGDALAERRTRADEGDPALADRDPSLLGPTHDENAVLPRHDEGLTHVPEGDFREVAFECHLGIPTPIGQRALSI